MNQAKLAGAKEDRGSKLLASGVSYDPGTEALTRPTRLDSRCSILACCVVAVAFVLCPRAAGQGQDYVKGHYTKFEYRIPMRDGKKLFTAVYVPKDPSQRYPIWLTRTPYSVQP